MSTPTFTCSTHEQSFCIHQNTLYILVIIGVFINSVFLQSISLVYFTVYQMRSIDQSAPINGLISRCIGLVV